MHSDYKEYNLSSIKCEDDIEILTCFNIVCNPESLWYLYDQKLGLIRTSEETLNYMLNSGWKTKSDTLQEEIKHK